MYFYRVESYLIQSCVWLKWLKVKSFDVICGGTAKKLSNLVLNTI